MRLNLVLLCLVFAGCGPGKPPASGTTATERSPAPQPVLQNPDAGHASVVPGESVGPLRRDTTRADLTERLGAGALKDQDIDIGEGQVQAGTVIHAGTDHELRAVWQTAERQALAWVHVIGDAWELPGGVHPGASLNELQASIGPFTLNGFVGDNSGVVDLTGTRLAAHADSTTLRLTADGTRETCRDTAMQAPTLSSDDAVVQACSPSLGDVIVRF